MASTKQNIKAACFYKRAVEQFNGREGAHSDFLIEVSCFPKLACQRFRPTSSQPLGGYRLNRMRR